MRNAGTETEAALVAQAQKGDRNAYGELVRIHHQGVIRVVYRMCADAGLAEDAAQEAFIRAWLNLHSFQPGTSLRSWLYRIAVNAALDVLRRESGKTAVEFETLHLADPQDGPETALLQKERTAAVREAIGELSEASRSVLVLREYGELSYQEIAAALDIPVGTVMSRLNYARKQLRQSLQRTAMQMEVQYA